MSRYVPRELELSLFYRHNLCSEDSEVVPSADRLKEERGQLKSRGERG
jgi:hypothetical protein